MLRRAVLLTLGSALASACTPVPKPDPNAPPLGIPPDAPPPSKIRRLLVWLPPPAATDVYAGVTHGAQSVLFNNAVFVEALKRALQPYGVEVAVGIGSGFELDRRDEQRALMDQFNPTHRLEVDVVNVMSSRYAHIAEMRWQLFDAKDKKPVRFKSFAATGNDAKLRADVDYAVKHLEAQGFL